MFSLDEKIRFYLCQQPVSMRYGIRGLTNIVLSWPGFSHVGMRIRILFLRQTAGEDTTLGL